MAAKSNKTTLFRLFSLTKLMMNLGSIPAMRGPTNNSDLLRRSREQAESVTFHVQSLNSNQQSPTMMNDPFPVRRCGVYSLPIGWSLRPFDTHYCFFCCCCWFWALHRVQIVLSNYVRRSWRTNSGVVPKKGRGTASIGSANGQHNGSFLRTFYELFLARDWGVGEVLECRKCYLVKCWV